jgi:rRNA maturation endonuclease Nob1
VHTEVPQYASKIETLNIGQSACNGCGNPLENDLDFCASCGEKR